MTFIKDLLLENIGVQSDFQINRSVQSENNNSQNK